MPQSQSSKFSDKYKRKSTRIDNRERRSLDWKQSRNKVVGQRRNIMEAAGAMSPVAESRAESKPQKPASGSSLAGSY